MKQKTVNNIMINIILNVTLECYINKRAMMALYRSTG